VIAFGGKFDNGDGNHAKRIDVNTGRYTEASLPLNNIADEKPMPAAENTT
jgi:hypothetical protein